ncbi:MAG: dephospho-CoA kinase, partial [Gammaproteobacteria bacterium]
IEAPAALRASRFKARRSLDAESFERINASQATDDARAAVADEIITNDGTIEALKEKTIALHEKLLALAAQKHEP